MKLSVSALRLLGWCLLPWVSLGLVLLLLTSPLNTFFFLFFFSFLIGPACCIGAEQFFVVCFRS